MGGLVILQSFGIAITPILTPLGVGGLAVALALQDRFLPAGCGNAAGSRQGGSSPCPRGQTRGCDPPHSAPALF
jgi:hypothetical protein